MQALHVQRHVHVPLGSGNLLLEGRAECDVAPQLRACQLVLVQKHLQLPHAPPVLSVTGVCGLQIGVEPAAAARLQFAAAETVAVACSFSEPPPGRCMLYSSSYLADAVTVDCPDALQLWVWQ
jgi:hypothetical protein